MNDECSEFRSAIIHSVPLACKTTTYATHSAAIVALINLNNVLSRTLYFERSFVFRHEVGTTMAFGVIGKPGPAGVVLVGASLCFAAGLTYFTVRLWKARIQSKSLDGTLEVGSSDTSDRVRLYNCSTR